MRIRIPLRFYEDHQGRDLDTPVNYSKSKSYAVIDSNDPAIGELLSDARYYASEDYVDPAMWEGWRGLVLSARATIKAIEKACLCDKCGRLAAWEADLHAACVG